MTMANRSLAKKLVHAEAPQPPMRLDIADGTSAAVEDGAIALRDAKGRLLVRFIDGRAEITAATGDLELAAPNGRVAIKAGTDFVVEAARDVVSTAGRAVELRTQHDDEPQLRVKRGATQVKTERLEIASQDARFVAGSARVFAHKIATTATEVATNVERYELTANRIVERAVDTFRDATGLLQTRAGRVREIVKGLYSLHSRRTTIASEDETSIDGKKILLG
jgi:hypothetical protein